MMFPGWKSPCRTVPVSGMAFTSAVSCARWVSVTRIDVERAVRSSSFMVMTRADERMGIRCNCLP